MAADDSTIPLNALRQLVAVKRSGLDRIRAAFKTPSGVPFHDVGRGNAIATFREAARLFSGEARLALADRQNGRAAESCLDAIELAGDISRDGDLLDLLVGESMLAKAAKQLDPIVPALSSPEANGALRRLNRIDAEWGELSVILRHSGDEKLAQIRSIWSTQRWYGRLFVRPDEPGRWQRVLRLELYPRRLAFRRLQERLDLEVAEARKPYFRQRAAPTVSDLDELLMPPIIGFVGLKSAVGQAYRRLLRLRLALRIYHQEHGAYPATLGALAPVLGENPPVDPFADAPIRYERTDRGYRLWSIGPDGTDDLGRIALARDIRRSSKGDLVAGNLLYRAPAR